MRFCDKCENIMNVFNNTYKCISCDFTQKLEDNTIVYSININEKKEIAENINSELTKYDIFRQTLLSYPCTKCNHDVAVMYTNNTMNSILVCSNCNTKI